MTSSARLASTLLEPIGRLEDAAPEPEDVALAREERVVAAIMAAASSRPRVTRRGWLIAGGAVLPLAAGIVLYVGLTHHVTPTAPSTGTHWLALDGRVRVFDSDGRETSARLGQALNGEERLVVPERSEATIELPSGAAARLGERTELMLGGSGITVGQERLSLSRGYVSLVVPRLGAGRSLSVATPQALVTVLGTRFAVSVVYPRGTGDARTCVSVDAGRVLVNAPTSTHSLGPGGHWSSDGGACAETRAATAPPAPALPTSTGIAPASSVVDGGSRSLVGMAPPPNTQKPGSARRAAQPTTPDTSQASAGSEPPTAAFGVSTLDQQVQLFGAAMQARRSGDRLRAAERLQRLLAEHPDSPLAGQARRELDVIRGESEE